MVNKNYKKEALVPGNYYHIYNRGNNAIDIFFESGNYEYFLKLYQQYIYPIAETYAWCLMKNHFHVLVYVRLENEIINESLAYSTVEKPKVIEASKQFGHLFNAYTQAMNKKYGRTGSLFEKPFERKCVTSDKYLKNLVHYIHNNPVHHGICKNSKDYKWSSYESILSGRPTKLKRDEVLEMYGNKEDFILSHNESSNFNDILDFIIE